jgi:hypothetical protein
MRIIAVGGRGLFYAWAFEQKNAKSGHQFPAHDVLVPWHLKENNGIKQPVGEEGDVKQPVGEEGDVKETTAEDAGASAGGADGADSAEASSGDGGSNIADSAEASSGDGGSNIGGGGTATEDTYAPVEARAPEGETTKAGMDAEEEATTLQPENSTAAGPEPTPPSTSTEEVTDEEDQLVFQRYCHVYKEGELEALVELIPEVEVAEVYVPLSTQNVLV